MRKQRENLNLGVDETLKLRQTSNMESSKESLSASREALDILMELSNILNTGLDSETLSLCIQLCESGVNPDALAVVIHELRSAKRQMAQ
ncbi:mitotic-spindle organizing protein 1-like [Octopus sinensis]|uniref:Mitotic-spindle organizing protein 1-like n=1 Tax=Octopus sinensis TaxID=2607531 RepID=A0A7E6FKB6_9MOLL|nr:mitotic-spindle organizing protein 1-like [Octopus sinensis]